MSLRVAFEGTFTVNVPLIELTTGRDMSSEFREEKQDEEVEAMTDYSRYGRSLEEEFKQVRRIVSQSRFESEWRKWKTIRRIWMDSNSVCSCSYFIFEMLDMNLTTDLRMSKLEE